MDINWNIVSAIGTCIAAVVALPALCFVYLQLRLIAKTLRCQAYLKLADDWRDADLKEHVKAVLELWKTWKADASTEGKDSDVENWKNFINQRAKDWVDAHENESPKWESRRAISQFLSKLAPMVTNKYFTTDDVFGVVPEMARLLAVLIPIERAIREKYSSDPSVADWDFPFPKWEFGQLWPAYFEWFNKGGKRCLKLDPINWAEPWVGVRLPPK